MVRKHRLMERWLTDALGFDWVAADQEAARLEHAVSDAVVERLFEVLGHPQIVHTATRFRPMAWRIRPRSASAPCRYPRSPA